MVDVQLVKRQAIWSVPFLLILIVFGIWVFIDSTISTIYEISDLAPSVRIGLIGFAFPIAIFFLFMLFLIIIACISGWQKLAEFIEPAMLWSGLAFLAFAFLSFTLFKPIESYYMQKLGYSKCNKLDGNPTIWFQGWVRNPGWCVYKKTREWVSEQAGT